MLARQLLRSIVMNVVCPRCREHTRDGAIVASIGAVWIRCSRCRFVWRRSAISAFVRHVVAGMRSSLAPAAERGARRLSEHAGPPPLTVSRPPALLRASVDVDLLGRFDALDPVEESTLARRSGPASRGSLEELLQRLDGDAAPMPVVTVVPLEEALNRFDEPIAPQPAVVARPVTPDRDILQTTARALKAMESFSADLTALERQLDKMDEAYRALLGKSMVTI
jgi:hypothetical protein